MPGIDIVRGWRNQQWCGLAVEMSLHRLDEIVIGRFVLHGACGQNSPYPLAPSLPLFAACALRDVPVYGHKTDRLFCAVVGGFDTGGLDELKVFRLIIAQTFRY